MVRKRRGVSHDGKRVGAAGGAAEGGGGDEDDADGGAAGGTEGAPPRDAATAGGATEPGEGGPRSSEYDAGTADEAGEVHGDLISSALAEGVAALGAAAMPSPGAETARGTDAGDFQTAIESPGDDSGNNSVASPAVAVGDATDSGEGHAEDGTSPPRGSGGFPSGETHTLGL